VSPWPTAVGYRGPCTPRIPYEPTTVGCRRPCALRIPTYRINFRRNSKQPCLQRLTTMSHAQVFIAIHVIFATKDRNVALPTAILPDLHRVIGKLINENGGQSIPVGGTRDHVHALFLLDRMVRPVDLVREIKHKSSRWISGQPCCAGRFQWQNGYAAFSVSASQVDVVKKYIGRQETHHTVVTFDHELGAFLNRYRLNGKSSDVAQGLAAPG